MKVIIFIFALPFYIIKFILWVAISLLIVFFGGIGIVIAQTNFEEVNDAVKGLWDGFLLTAD